MPLVVRPVELADVSQCIKLRIDSFGSSIIGHPPPYPGYVAEQEASMCKHFTNQGGVSRNVRFIKVVDDDGDQSEVIAYARWEFHPERSEQETQNHGNDNDKKVDQFWKLREEAVKYFQRCTDNIKGYPYFLLAMVVTAEAHRRRGAGGLLLKCGIEAADKLGYPCYLEASEEAKSLYQHHGFKDMETTEFDLTLHNLQGVQRITQMVREPVKKPAPSVSVREITPGTEEGFIINWD